VIEIYPAQNPTSTSPWWAGETGLMHLHVVIYTGIRRWLTEEALSR